MFDTQSTVKVLPRAKHNSSTHLKQKSDLIRSKTRTAPFSIFDLGVGKPDSIINSVLMFIS